MQDSRPLSERFDLTYVQKRHFADRWTAALGLGLALLVAAGLGGLTLFGGNEVYSSGPLTNAHAMFAHDCGKCHAPDPAGSGFWLPARDELCLACHVAPLHNPHQSQFVGTARAVGSQEVVMSSSCAVCHVEHQGHDADLTLVSDQTCVRCHADLRESGWRAPSMQSGDSSAPGQAEQGEWR